MHLTKTLSDAFDWLYSDRNTARFERLVMIAACVGFLLHLGIIATVRHIEPASPFLRAVGDSYFAAIYTPFSFILFYEVLMLVRALPQSITTAMGKQFEILSLITVRSVFKDIAELGDIEGWTQQTEALTILLVDMTGAVLMFVLVGCFYHLRRRRDRGIVPDRLTSFIALKKSIAVLLTALFVIMAATSLIGWLASVIGSSSDTSAQTIDVDQIFFPGFFKVMIFTDVLLLILSFSISKSYRFVFRNAGFVISTILLRVSVTAPTYYDVSAAIVGMAFGIAILAAFNYLSFVRSRERGVNDTPHGNEEDPAPDR